jgi:ubiquinone biosynthesis protein
MRLGLLKRYEHIRRLRKIADVLIKHGLGYLTKRLGLYPYVPFKRRIVEPKLVEELTLPERGRLVLEDLGPTYVKFGQVLSTRPDLVPKEYIEEFRKLLDEVPPFSYQEVERVIEEELGRGVDELFRSFDKKPYASASIGQVHVAKLITGEDVVVKIQRPSIEDVIEADIDILASLAGLVERHFPETRPYDPRGIVREFAKTIRRELDYTREGRNADKFRRNFEKVKYVYIPKVYWDYTGKRVLTLEYVHGVKVGDIEELEAREYDKRRIAKNMVKAFLKQVYIDGFFQGDPHPANILVMEDEVISFIDFGMIGRIDKELMDKLADIFVAVVRGDMEKIVDRFLDIGIIGEETDIRDFKMDAGEMIDQYYGIPLREISMATLLNEVLELAMEHRIRIPSNFALLVKGMVTIEAVAAELDPEFNFAEIAEPFVRKLVKKRLQPKALAAGLIEDISGFGEVMVSVPRRLDRVLEKAEKDKIMLEHRGFSRLISALDATSNRIAFALITSAIIVGSSLIMQTEKGPLLFGYPFLGLLGFAFASILGGVLLISIIRSGRL